MLIATDIKINGHLSVDILLEFCLTECLNQHSYIIYKGIVNQNNVNNVIKFLSQKDNISVMIEEKVAFNGIPLSASLHCENEVHILTVHCVSHSFLLDTQSTSHSFQNIEMLYEDLICLLFEDSGIGGILVRDIEDRKIGNPIIKYEETDWQFTKRMATQIGTVIYPHAKGTVPQIYCGVTMADNQIDLSVDYKEGYNTALYFQQKLYHENLTLEDYFYITFQTDKNFNIGEQLTVNVKNKRHRLFICEKRIELTCDVVVTRYTVSSICPYVDQGREDEKLTGLTLAGTVLDTQSELLQIHLDIDDKQDKQTAYWFDYKPAVGNVFHVMPQIGTKVLLKLNRNHGGSGFVTHVFHETADSQVEMADYNKRYFTTEFKKRLAMLPELLDFKNKEKNHHIELADDKGITGTTSSEFKIIAEEDIMIHAEKKLTVYSPEKIYFTKIGTESRIEMAGGDIHIKSKCSKLISRSKKTVNTGRQRAKLPAMEISSALALKAKSLMPTCITPIGKRK